MVNFVVSHSKKLASEAIKLAQIIKFNNFKIYNNAVGFVKSKEFNTDVQYILKNINKTNEDDCLIVFCEIGISLLSSQMAI
ncbi:PTS sugar transporter subunit IIA domain-containing protein [Mycoplasmopsis cricetuli]|uniref:PTS sugar transporter subunit IIA domain-containing protein n=1 Tax=Mycoplasmopsis cricetuli TaxID=171283 RepID=UPI000472D21C|nr:hypothetical protein [Mycoplasmopsis cricetuli]